MVLRLFTTWYDERSPGRLGELRECFERNLACGEIDELCVLREGGEVPDAGGKRVRVRKIGHRPRYQDYFDWINELAEIEDVSVISNSDIWHDGHLGVLRCWRLPEREVLALSRWNVAEGGEVELYDHNDSQDSWVLRGRVSGVEGGIPVGVPRCDNRIAAEFERAGYVVRNPAFSIRTYHVHAGVARVYDAEAPNRLISPPYKYVWPHNLWGWPRTVRHWVGRPGVPVGYRVDGRWWARTLPGKVWRRVSGTGAAGKGRGS